MSVGDTIKRVRNTLLLEQHKFAELLEVTAQTISNYETGNRKPPLSILRKIKQIAEQHNIEVTVEDLLEDKKTDKS